MSLSPEQAQRLIAEALSARQRAYAPYSGVKVGAALLTAAGTVYRGCNMENAAYSPSLCAERAAFASAIVDGCQDFLAIAIVGGPADMDAPLPEYFWPCGVCRQVMTEFCRPELIVIAARSMDDSQQLTLGQLLPEAFGKGHL